MRKENTLPHWCMSQTLLFACAERARSLSQVQGQAVHCRAFVSASNRGYHWNRWGCKADGGGWWNRGSCDRGAGNITSYNVSHRYGRNGSSTRHPHLRHARKHRGGKDVKEGEKEGQVSHPGPRQMHVWICVLCRLPNEEHQLKVWYSACLFV